ncbi:MAG: beta-ketoacyl-[acyl-carrier-protein] synthase family protein, partial [Bacteroidales bacterium]|nr:beta-ketoacyl-[acyl-carrier-protein] synthase family protein [Bacteroidales bacterium]
MGKIVVTGMGIVSALGAGKEATLHQLRAGKAAIGKMKHLGSRHTQLPVAEVPFSNDELKEILNIPTSKIINRSTLIGRLALREALSESGLTKDFHARTAFLSGNTVGGMDVSELFYQDFLSNDRHNEYIRLHDCGVCTEMIADEFSVPLQFTTTISTACSSAANAIIFGANLIKKGEIDVAVVG